MHGDAALTPVAIAMGYAVRYGVPLLCAAIASLPAVVVLGAAYLLAVVFARGGEPGEVPAGPGGP